MKRAIVCRRRYQFLHRPSKRNGNIFKSADRDISLPRFELSNESGRQTSPRGKVFYCKLRLVAQSPDLDANPADYVERKQMLERLNRAVSGLGERCREMMRLKLHGKTFPEIQAIMGAAAINTIYTWDHRCRKNLLDAMGGDWERPKR